MGVGVVGVANYTNVASGTATGVIAYGGVGGPYEHCSFFSVLNWFASGEQGAWYDPSDLTTLFQDSAGTTPVTAVEQPVGLMKDKSGRNNHAFQATAGNRPTLSARVNLLLSSAVLPTQTVTTDATTYKLTFVGSGTVTLLGTATGVYTEGTNTFTATAGTLTLTIAGSVTFADLRPTNSGALLPSYQRVNTASDYDTVGFPLYLKCNGSAMSTNSINFTSTDKVTIVIGVRKLDNILYQCLLELSSNANNNNGTFVNFCPGSAPNINEITWHSRGTNTSLLSYTGVLAIPPYARVQSYIGDIASDISIMRLNSSQVASNLADQGTGTYGNYPLYLFNRDATTFNFKGCFYGAIIRGARSDTVSLIKTEQYMATKTGIVI